MEANHVGITTNLLQAGLFYVVTAKAKFILVVPEHCATEWL